MHKVSETIPEALAPRVDAALAWFNAKQTERFKVTGILDAEASLAGSDELRLILCGGDRCEQHSFRVSGAPDAWRVESAESAQDRLADTPQADLDPPPGPRRDWLDQKLARHAFVVLIFYRGFW